MPEDPLALVVEDPESVAVVRVQELQSSPVFERLRPYIEQAACVKLSDWSAVLAATRRAALAARQKPEQAPEWLIVLDGRYTDADARHLLAVVIERSHSSPSAEPARELKDSSGRFGVTEQGTLAVSLLESRVIVLGTQAWLRSALASIAQPVAKFADSVVWREVGLQLGCHERSACVLSTANGMNARNLERGLSGAGAKELGQSLAGADNALAVSASNGLGLGFAAQLDSSDAAQNAERALRDWLWQANLVVRLTGLPAIFDRARLSTQHTLVRAELDVSQADLEAYEARARPVFEREVAGCSNDAQSP